MAKSDVQLGSADVAGLPSLAASWIAVCGRQAFHASLSLKHAMSASADPRLVADTSQVASVGLSDV